MTLIPTGQLVRAPRVMRLAATDLSKPMEFTAPIKTQSARLHGRTRLLLVSLILFLSSGFRALKTSVATPARNHGYSRIIYRTDFASFVRNGSAVEVGTYDGNFAEKNLNKFKGEYYMVDIAVRPRLQQRLRLWVEKTFVVNLSIKRPNK